MLGVVDSESVGVSIAPVRLRLCIDSLSGSANEDDLRLSEHLLSVNMIGPSLMRRKMRESQVQ